MSFPLTRICHSGGYVKSKGDDIRTGALFTDREYIFYFFFRFSFNCDGQRAFLARIIDAAGTSKTLSLISLCLWTINCPCTAQATLHVFTVHINIFTPLTFDGKIILSHPRSKFHRNYVFSTPFLFSIPLFISFSPYIFINFIYRNIQKVENLKLTSALDSYIYTFQLYNMVRPWIGP